MEAPAYDVFISHASEDKRDVAQPLAKSLEQLGYKVWLDKQELRLGDQLRRKINQGLSRSRYGVVILSKAFFSKSWPMEELDALMGREGIETTIVLPIRHGLSHEQVRSYHPTVANKLSATTDGGLQSIVEQIKAVLGSPLGGQSVPHIAPSNPQRQPVTSDRGAHILETLDELEKRATICLAQSMESNNPNANEHSSPVIAANIASHEEHGAVDSTIREYAKLVLGRLPTEDEWRSHTERLFYLQQRDGHHPKTARDGYKEQLNWIRLSRMYVRKLRSMERPQ
jgi:TIR domain-containing protein